MNPSKILNGFAFDPVQFCLIILPCLLHPRGSLPGCAANSGSGGLVIEILLEQGRCARVVNVDGRVVIPGGYRRVIAHRAVDPK